MKTFAKRKEHALWKMQELDRSKKGSVDRAIKPLLEAINAHTCYYTTSSCAGRILLLREPDSQKKNEYGWPHVTHEQADAERFLEALAELEGVDGTVWLRMQTVIVHVACKDLESANRLLKQFSPFGWKRSGIFSVENDIMLELLSVENMDAPVIKDGQRLVEEGFVRAFIEEANKKLSVAHEKIVAGAERVKNLGSGNI